MHMTFAPTDVSTGKAPWSYNTPQSTLVMSHAIVARMKKNRRQDGWFHWFKEIFRTIDALRKTGVTTALVEQNARAALETANYAYVLEMGEIAFEGPASELAHDPRVIGTYLGAASGKR